MKPTHLDLFSGIGGFALAAKWAGFETVGFSEIEPYACAVLKKNFPKIKNYGDIRTIQEIGCDLLTAGFPCQDVSIANQEAEGIRGARSGLVYQAIRIVKKNKPMGIVFENVTALRTRGHDEICVALEKIGYVVGSFNMGAWSVGSCQSRQRTWIIAHSPKIRMSGHFKGGNTSKIRQGRKGCEANLFGKDWRTRQIFSGEPSPLLCRGNDGIPNRMDRIGSCGNAIVPQVAYQILKAIRSLI